jgi:hypothetical protein
MKRADGFLGVSLAASLLLSACKQDVGDRCQVTSDCRDGLICVLGNNSSLTGGTCQSTGGGVSVDAATVDSGTPDLSVTDSATQDNGVMPDAALGDAARDSSMIDLAMVD